MKLCKNSVVQGRRKIYWLKCNQKCLFKYLPRASSVNSQSPFADTAIKNLIFNKKVSLDILMRMWKVICSKYQTY